MKKLLAIITSLLLLFIASASFVSAKDGSRQQKVIKVSSDEIVDKDFYVAGGDIVEISGTVNGDVIIAGGQLLIDGLIKGDLLAAGGTISITGEIEQDVRLGGGQITISGVVGRNMALLGGVVELTDSARIGGGLVAAGGNIFIKAPISGDVLVGAGNLTIANTVGGNVDAGVGALQLTSKAEILGNFRYYSDETPSIDKEATVSGKIVERQGPEYFGTQEIPSLGNFFEKLANRRLQTKFISFATALVFGLLLLRFYPNYVKGVAKTVRKELWKSLGAGFLILIFVPLISFILFATIIGFPMGLICAFSYIVYMYTAKIFIAVCIGDYVYERTGKTKTAHLPFVVGLAIYYLLRIPPLIGGLTGFVVLLLGLGAAAINYKQFHKNALKHKVI